LDHAQLKSLTKQMLACCHEAAENFQRRRKTGEKGDFYKEVKPFADQVKTLCEKWEPLAVEWTIARKPKHLFPQQLKNTAENLQMVSVRSFDPDSSLKRFNSHIQSIEYILKRFLGELEQS
jgi:hypothetical protein